MRKLTTIIIMVIIAAVAIPCLAQAKMSGSERAALVKTIDTAIRVNAISAAEGGTLKSIVNMDFGYPRLYADYITYKKAGKSMDEFLAAVYNGTLPK